MGGKITISCQEKFGIYSQVIKVIRLDQHVNPNMLASIKILTGQPSIYSIMSTFSYK